MEFKLNSKLFGIMLNNLSQGILIINEDRKIQDINESLSDLFYMDTPKVIGKRTVLVFNNGKLEDLIGKVLQSRTPAKEDIVFYGDEDLYLSIEAIPIDLEDSVNGPGNTRNKKMVLLIIDNTTQEVEFSRLRSQFAATVSHEMRTPLTSIKGYIETLMESGVKDKELIKDYLSKSLKEVEKLNFLIKDVLDLSKIEYRRNVLFQDKNDLVAIIKDTINSLDFLSRKNDVNIDLTYSKEKILYNTDEELFNQMVRNILENSIFYSGKGSKINVIIDEKEDHILLDFIDNGAGIKKEDLPFIFQRFYRGRPDSTMKRIGSGLGLSIVKHTVDLHGGEIKVESKPGVQTRFSVALPKNIKKTDIRQ
jgi:two-component system phosphate regulon sensor histidine kinase PhoR